MVRVDGVGAGANKNAGKKQTHGPTGKKPPLYPLDPHSPTFHTIDNCVNRVSAKRFRPAWSRCMARHCHSLTVLNTMPLLTAFQPHHLFALAAHLQWGNFLNLKGALFSVNCKELPSHDWGAMHHVLGRINTVMGRHQKHASSTPRCTLVCASAPTVTCTTFLTRHMPRCTSS